MDQVDKPEGGFAGRPRITALVLDNVEVLAFSTLDAKRVSRRIVPQARTLVRRVWLPAVRGSIGEPYRFHYLRHTHVALLIDQGIHIKVIQERLGHASVRTTLDVYGHLFEGLDEGATDAIDTAFASLKTDKPRRAADTSRTSPATALPR